LDFFPMGLCENFTYLVKKPWSSAVENQHMECCACYNPQHASKHVDSVWILSGYLLCHQWCQH
jgi:hypothetical protein